MINTNRINGNSLPQAQPSTFNRDESGSHTKVVFEMTSRAQFYALTTLLNQAGVMYESQEGFGKHTVTALYPYDYQLDPSTEPPVILWEMIPNKTEKSIIDADNVNTRALIQQDISTLNMLVDDIQRFIFSVQNPPPTGSGLQYGDLDPTQAAWAISGAAPPAGAYASSLAAQVLFNLLVSGVKSQIVFQPTLRLTQTVNDAYPIGAGFENVGSIISSQSLPILYNVPNDLLFNLPVDSDPQLSASRPVLHYGWFMDAPEVRQIAWLKWQLVFNWQYGLWPEAMYGIPI
jgi:hypothetical protein